MKTELLDNARCEIDRLDREIAALLVRRIAEVDKVAKWKKANGMPIYVPDREAAVIEKVCSIAGKEFQEEISAVYQAIFRTCRIREKQTVADVEEQE